MNEFETIKFLLFFTFTLMTIINIINENEKIKKIKVCLCTNGKLENLYVREYVQHYINLGVDKIFIYDNNEKKGEKFEDKLMDYINSGLVEIIDYRGLIAPQAQAYKDCYKKNYKKYNWLIFFDMDEYIFLRNYKNIKNYLKKKKFNKCQRIQLNWIFHTDNNLLNYDNRTLSERFPEREKKARGKKTGKNQGIKSILRGNILTKVYDVHILNQNLTGCDGFGNIRSIKGISTDISDFKYHYIDHYYSKSTEEFITKLKRGSAVHGFDLTHILKRIDVYFSINEITKKKLDYIEKKTNLNLSKFRTQKNL